MKLKDYTQGKSVKELTKLYRAGEFLSISRGEKIIIIDYLRELSRRGEPLSRKDQLRAVVLLDDKYRGNSVLLGFDLHTETLQLLESSRHEDDRMYARFHKSVPTELFLERGKADRYSDYFYGGLRGRNFDRDSELYLLRVTKKSNLMPLLPHLTVRLEDEEFQNALLNTMIHGVKRRRSDPLYFKVWSTESLDEVYRSYSDDLSILELLCSHSNLSEKTSSLIMSGEPTLSMKKILAANTPHYFVWDILFSDAKVIAKAGEGNPFFGSKNDASKKTGGNK